MVDEEWMDARTNKSGECWTWTSTVGKVGYGVAAAGNFRDYAHRVSYWMFNGPIPKGLYVCHKCDNRLCVRPDHLFLGTHLDNVQDALRKGRIKSPPPQFGETNPLAKLDEDKVREIRRAASAGESHASIAGRFGVTAANVGYVVRRVTWKQVM